MNNVYIKRHPVKGRCVHASRKILAGELIEENHVITYPFLEKGNKILDWSMEWTDTEDALALGNINLLNHSEDSNCGIENDFVNMTKRVYANFDIEKDEELTIHYGCELWF